MPTNIMDVYNSTLQGYQQGRKNRLASLLGQAYQAPQDQRQGLLGQAAQIDPVAAGQYGEGLNKQDDQGIERVAKAAMFLARLPEQARAQAYPSVRGQLVKSAPQLESVLPQIYDQSAAEVVGQFGQIYGGTQNNVPSGIQEMQYLQKIGGFSEDEKKRQARVAAGLEARPVTGGAQISWQRDSNGNMRPWMFDPRTQAFVDASEMMGGGPKPAQPQQTQPQPLVGTLPDGSTYDIRGLEPESQQQVLAQISAMSQQDPRGASPVGRTPEEEAAAVERAKLDAQFGADRQRAGFDVDQAAAVESAKAGATANVKAGTIARANSTALAAYNQAMGSLESDMGNTTTGFFAGRLPAVTANQQIADGAVAAMAPILKGLFRTAGEGTFTDKDQALLMAMIPTRTDLPEARTAKVANINAIVRAKLGSSSGQSSAGGKYQVGQVIEANGKRYRITGGDMNDPDVEEVR